MTVLQKIIQDVDGYSEMSIEHFIAKLQGYLHAEEQQLRDAWKASELYEDYLWAEGAGHTTKPPNIETYLTHLKTKA